MFGSKVVFIYFTNNLHLLATELCYDLQPSFAYDTTPIKYLKKDKVIDDRMTCVLAT